MQGGGHSSLSPLHGLAVDNLLEADIVTADGTLVTANSCTNADLFWALRGGGGGTFGVVTRVVYKAHEPEENFFGYNSRIQGSNGLVCALAGSDCAEGLVGAFNDFMNYTQEH